ncbi:MAG: tRNA (N(6)-L-threonylcarbamoyladenosine(37)-C(2))-methylthiotransferase MtaB [Bacteroidales bacterium]
MAFNTLGCKLNFAETSTISRSFTAKGFEQVDFNDVADIYVINTCSVTQKADKKSQQAVNKARKNNPNAKIIVVGCYAQLQPGKVADIPGVDLVLGSHEKFRITEFLHPLNEHSHKEKIFACGLEESEKYYPSYSFGDRTRSFLKIQDGCDYPCSYCTIPKARGKSRNPDIESIIRQAETIGNSGVKEIILTGVNIGDFGKSTGENFFDLIKKLEKVNNIDRFRISSIEPNLLSKEIIEFVASSEKFMPHFHIPLQSGSDEILAKMRRRYNTELFKNKIKTINEVLPHAFIGVDLIVGFPGEKEALFRSTYRFLESLDVSYYHVFSFSARPDTSAEKMGGKIPGNIIHERSKQIQKLAEYKKLNFYKRFLGTHRDVLFEKVTKNNKIYGFTDNYIKVETNYKKNLSGEIKNIKLVNINPSNNVNIKKNIPSNHTHKIKNFKKISQ